MSAKPTKPLGVVLQFGGLIVFLAALAGWPNWPLLVIATLMVVYGGWAVR
jgi:flagellar biosynthesis component FlhA